MFAELAFEQSGSAILLRMLWTEINRDVPLGYRKNFPLGTTPSNGAGRKLSLKHVVLGIRRTAKGFFNFLKCKIHLMIK